MVMVVIAVVTVSFRLSVLVLVLGLVKKLNLWIESHQMVRGMQCHRTANNCMAACMGVHSCLLIAIATERTKRVSIN